MVRDLLWTTVSGGTSSSTGRYYAIPDGSVSGDVNDIILTTGNSLATLNHGDQFFFRTTGGNTGNVSIEIDSVTSLRLVKANDGGISDLSTNDLSNADTVLIIYDAVTNDYILGAGRVGNAAFRNVGTGNNQLPVLQAGGVLNPDRLADSGTVGQRLTRTSTTMEWADVISPFDWATDGNIDLIPRAKTFGHQVYLVDSITILQSQLVLSIDVLGTGEPDPGDLVIFQILTTLPVGDVTIKINDAPARFLFTQDAERARGANINATAKYVMTRDVNNYFLLSGETEHWALTGNINLIPNNKLEGLLTQIMAGTNITIDDSTSGEITISASGGGISDGVVNALTLALAGSDLTLTAGRTIGVDISSSALTLPFALLSGATFTGAVSGITPTDDEHFATKLYVDNNSGGSGTGDITSIITANNSGLQGGAEYWRCDVKS